LGTHPWRPTGASGARHCDPFVSGSTFGAERT
jgi:hypothetical protein